VPSDADDDRREQRHQQILAVAQQVFAELGYHKASINEIITRANIARGTFYLYFSSKESVFNSILDGALSELSSRITRIEVDDPGADPPQDQLRQNLIRLIGYVLSDRPLAQLLLDHSQNPQAKVAERVDEFFVKLASLLRSSLERGITMKLVRPCNTSVAAWGLMGAARGMIEYCLKAETPPSVDEIVDELNALALRGVFTG